MELAAEEPTALGGSSINSAQISPCVRTYFFLQMPHCKRLDPVINEGRDVAGPVSASSLFDVSLARRSRACTSLWRTRRMVPTGSGRTTWAALDGALPPARLWPEHARECMDLCRGRQSAEA